jgi:hypothetical protein
MEYVEGDSLAALLERQRFEPDEVLRLRDRLASGLAAAHDVGIVHRDLSPENVIIPEGRVERAKLIDFGIAKSMDAGAGTLIGADFAGKYGFVSPEQTGLFSGRVDLRSDIYSLGLVLAAAAIGFGKKLDMGNSPSTVIAARQRPPDLSAVPASLRGVIAPMLRPRPEDRPPSMRALLDNGERKDRRNAKWRSVAVGLGALLAIPAAILALTRPWEPPPSPDEIRGKLAEMVPRYRCVALDYDVGADNSVRLSGFAVAPDGIDGLRREIAAIRSVRPPRIDDLRQRARPYCDVLALLNPLLQRKSGPAAGISLVSGTEQAAIGEALTLDIQAPDFDGAIYVDYVSSEGEVLHLFPNDNDRERVAFQPKRRHFVLGRPPGKCWTLSGSTGEQLVMLIAAKKPLFTGRRHELEWLSDYLANLSAAISKAPQDGLAAAVLFFTLRDAAGQTGSAAEVCPSG